MFHLQDVMHDLLSEFYEDALESLEKQIQKAKQPRITHEAPDYPKDPASEHPLSLHLLCIPMVLDIPKLSIVLSFQNKHIQSSRGRNLCSVKSHRGRRDGWNIVR